MDLIVISSDSERLWCLRVVHNLQCCLECIICHAVLSAWSSGCLNNCQLCKLLSQLSTANYAPMTIDRGISASGLTKVLLSRYAWLSFSYTHRVNYSPVQSIVQSSPVQSPALHWPDIYHPLWSPSTMITINDGQNDWSCYIAQYKHVASNHCVNGDWVTIT